MKHEFKNFVSRKYADADKTSGRWKLETLVFAPDEAAEIDRRFECLKPYLGRDIGGRADASQDSK